MAKRIWTELSNGKIKLWKESKADIRWRVPGHWYRNYLNRRERRKSKMALVKGKAHSFPYIHQRFATRF
jgi:hypothetical protein